MPGLDKRMGITIRPGSTRAPGVDLGLEALALRLLPLEDLRREPHRWRADRGGTLLIGIPPFMAQLRLWAFMEGYRLGGVVYLTLRLHSKPLGRGSDRHPQSQCV